METLLEIMRWVHAAFGGVALVAGTAALATKKGSTRHTVAGRVFLGALAGAFASILLHIISEKNVFMFGIGWLALFAGFEGWRALQRHKGSLTLTPSVLDQAISGVTGLGALGLLAYGAQAFVLTGNLMGLACAGFGVLGLSLLRNAWRRWQNPPTQRQWLAVHILMMTGAYSAALTAFLAIQLSGRVGSWEWVVWVGPTLIMAKVGARAVKQRGLDT